MYSRLWSNRRLFLNFSSIIHSPKPISNNQNVCVLKGWPHFHVDQWPRWNYVSMFWDLECNYPIGSIQHRSHLNVWFIADWWLVYFDLQFNLDLCFGFQCKIFTMTLIFAKEYFIDKKCDCELSILSIVGILLKCKFSSFSTSINI